MPLNDERPTSMSSGDDQSSDVESSSECCDSTAMSSDQDCSRHSFNSDRSSKHCTPSSSPPRILTLDEVMDVGKDLFNLKIAHEIVVNPDFHMDLSSTQQNSLWNLVKDNLHKAYWDILEAELTDDPPVYEHAIKLLEEIREILLSFLNPGANRMQTQIMEVLDIDLIRQQAENNAVDIQGLAAYIITTMGKICAPVRDGDIKRLQENTDNTVTLLKEIFRVLDLMRLDMVNSSIKLVKPILHQHAVEYEREIFQHILDKTPSALNHTTSWIQSVLEELLPSTVHADITNGKEQQALPGPFQILNTAFLRLLTWDYSKNPIPETLMTDEVRLQEIHWQLKKCEAVNEVLLIVFSTVGGPVQGIPSLSDRLKRMITVLLDGMHRPDFNLEESLESVSTQICCELNKSLTEREYPALTPELQATLKGQICNITQKDNPIRTLVEDRVQHYFMALVSDHKPQTKLEEVPAGLIAIKPELTLVGKMFLSLINYNKAVYGPFYANIIRKLMFSCSLPEASLPKATPQDPATSDSVTHS